MERRSSASRDGGYPLFFMMHFLAILGSFWALPVTCVGLLLSLVYWPRGVTYYRGALVLKTTRILGYVTNSKGERVPIAGQTWGNIIFIHQNHWPPERDGRLLKHEHVHTRQCWFWGPSILVLYPLSILQSWLIGGLAYKDSLLEVQAQRLSRK